MECSETIAAEATCFVLVEVEVVGSEMTEEVVCFVFVEAEVVGSVAIEVVVVTRVKL